MGGGEVHSAAMAEEQIIASAAEEPRSRASAQSMALRALCLIARFHQVAADPASLAHQLGLHSSEALTVTDLLRAAKHLGLKAKHSTSTSERLPLTPLPALALISDKEGQRRVVILAQCDGQRVLLQDPDAAAARPTIVPLDVFAQHWTGELILITSRASLAGELARFDFSWFIPAIVKYRRLLGEVMLVSLMLQLFALVSPLFFQVVMDKVLVHKGITTLDVLVIGLVAVVVFESVLNGLRSFIFSHTTSRIDVELGARLFRHLVQLPLAYFQARRVGDSVARVRELENIRSFLTGQALTVVLDAIFSIIFIAVMLFYNVSLTLIVLVSLPLYFALSLAVVPVLRKRLDVKFARGAESHSMLVETITGIQTVKASALEPSFGRRWDNQLAAYTATNAGGTGLPNWLSFDPASRTFSGTPANGDVGSLTLAMTATDTAGASASTTFVLTVVNVNDVPVIAQALGDQQVTQGLAWTFAVPAGAFADPDVGDQLTFTATLSDGSSLPSWLAFDPVTRTFSGTPGDGSAGVLPLEVIATDASGASANQVFHLSITSPQGKTIIGTSGNDWLTGTAGNDRIDGLAGTDVLNGGEGADLLNGGIGNDGLDGGAGADQMFGGAGNDLYAVDNGADSVTELGGEGNDTVLSSVSYSLSNNIENLVLTGSVAANGTGNDLSNAIVGNGATNFLRGLAGDDVISAAAGDDTLQGGTGSDFLSGGLGADHYLFGRGDGQDTIVDIDSTAGVQDVLMFGAGIAADQLWLRRVNSNLEISVIGSSDKVTVSGWYADVADHIEVLQLANGQRLLDSQVQNLVQAMASLSPPPMGQTTLSTSYQAKLEPLIATNWQ